MRTIGGDRLWVIGGTLGAITMLIIGWFFLIIPQNHETDALTEQTTNAQLQADLLRTRLTQLERENQNLALFKSQLTADRRALPDRAGMADFLRELENAATGRDVLVRNLIVGAPAEVTGVSAEIYQIPMTLAASGQTTALRAFLDQLQQVQPRAVLISAANLVSGDQPDTAGESLAGTVTLNLTLQVFVAPQPSPGSGSGASASATPATPASSAPATPAGAGSGAPGTPTPTRAPATVG